MIDKGRSLWADAWLRLKHNKAAFWSGIYLVFMAVICIAGPWVAPHDFDTIYENYNRVPPSLGAYPKPDKIEEALKEAVKSARVDYAGFKEKEGKIFVTLTSPKPIDERVTRYIDRSDSFEGAAVVDKSADGLRLTVSTQVKKEYFYFGTDIQGRDLLTRTLIAGRVSLAIGLLAGLVAVVIGVIYGALLIFSMLCPSHFSSSCWWCFSGATLCSCSSRWVVSSGLIWRASCAAKRSPSDVKNMCKRLKHSG
jgi:oligopeptide transport system permease protein